MERAISFRIPARSRFEGLSKAARTFFGLNIFQVFVIGGIQGAMIVLGDFSPVSEGGLGPGRKVYMALFLGAVLYSCFLCLFAVKKQNYLEILAFVFQNYGYVVYSCIQVYHICFKKYEDHDLRRQKNLVYLSLVDSGGLFLLNIIFTYLAVKLYGEYGWKIYKRVRFNIRLRAAYHIYETVIMLLKMVFLFLTMYAICLTQTVLRGQYESFNYIASMASILVCLLLSILGIISIRRENKILALVFIFGVGAAICYFIFKMIQVATKSCSECAKLKKEADDIPGEVELHLMYLASMNILFLVALLLASIKATRNFGIGLAAYFSSVPSSKMTVLSLSRNILTSIIPSSADETHSYPDIESPRPSVSNEPRPSIFQYLPKLLVSSRHSYSPDEIEQNKVFSLPIQFRKSKAISTHIGSNAKSRISQLFWESEFGHISKSQQSSFSTHRSSHCFRLHCCSWRKQRRPVSSTYDIPEANEPDDVTGNVIENKHRQDDDEKCSMRTRKRSRSLEIRIKERSISKRIPLRRLNSLPNEDMLRIENIEQSKEELERLLRKNHSSFRERKKDDCEFKDNTCFDHRKLERNCCIQIINSKENNDSESIESCSEQHNCVLLCHEIESSEAVDSKKNIRTEVQVTHPPLRCIKSSISSLTSLGTQLTEIDSDDSDTQNETPANDVESTTRRRKLAILVEYPENIRKSLSDFDISSKSNESSRIHFV